PKAGSRVPGHGADSWGQQPGPGPGPGPGAELDGAPPSLQVGSGPGPTICLGIIGSLGFLNNLLVLILFCRNKVLWSPINLLLMNISVSDMMVCIMGTPFSFAASTQGRWLIGPGGCIWYGFINTLFGTVSLISLAVLSYERYCTMMGSTEADATNYRKIWMGIFLSWMYSLFWTLPPLFGWSSYGPEGPGTTCSVNWHSRDWLAPWNSWSTPTAAAVQIMKGQIIYPTYVYGPEC
uniref:G-protein coupled receptors family 1 profile domain-containing protein n=1 Tax=Gopherus agassizii TaxID=38772 RepID=A0A452IDM2_9SAUR